MLIVLTILVAGITAGRLLCGHSRLVGACDKLTVMAIWALLFVLGAWVGSNGQVMGNLRKLSFDAGVICFCSVAGSLVALRLARGMLARGNQRD